jgi:hypothetical protein
LAKTGDFEMAIDRDEKMPNPSDLNLGTVALTSSSGVLYISTAGGDRSTRVPVPRGPLEIEVVGSQHSILTELI